VETRTIFTCAKTLEKKNKIMNGFRKYDHLEKFGHEEVEGLDVGTVYIFPKLDGTNGSAWSHEGEVFAGSRNRCLSLEADNQGFLAWLLSDEQEPLQSFLKRHPNLIVYGEWLCPHTLKTYRDESWRRFWVFDVWDRDKDRYLSWEEYSQTLIDAGFDVVIPQCKFTNPSHDQLREEVSKNTFLIADGAGIGEGIVCKNYQWANRHGRQPWLKLVVNAFKEQNALIFGITEKKGERIVEAEIVDKYVTPHLVGKTRAKVIVDIANEKGIDISEPNAQVTVQSTYRSKVIPQLLSRVFHDLITEEMWSILKEFKNPTVDFSKLNKYTTLKIKALAQDLF
jgi:hypothetical protein